MHWFVLRENGARVLVVCAALALGGCTDFALRDLREAQFNGTPFQQRLAMEYREISEDQVAVYDWSDAEHFAQKGMQIAYGADSLPDAPQTRQLAAAALPALKDAHARLMAARTPAVMAAKPRALAYAQAQYDSWLEQQEEGWRTDAITTARENFEAGFAKALGHPAPLRTTAAFSDRARAPVKASHVTGDANKGSVEVLAAPPELEQESALAPLAQQDFYVVFFANGSDRLNASGVKLLATIADDLKRSQGPWSIMLIPTG
jgi:outer membrane protein OmpA-like peptidoglycan-associated protein